MVTCPANMHVNILANMRMLFRKKFTQQEIRAACNEMQDLTTKWHTDVETGSHDHEDEHSL